MSGWTLPATRSVFFTISAINKTLRHNLNCPLFPWPACTGLWCTPIRALSSSLRPQTCLCHIFKCGTGVIHNYFTIPPSIRFLSFSLTAENHHSQTHPWCSWPAYPCNWRWLLFCGTPQNNRNTTITHLTRWDAVLNSKKIPWCIYNCLFCVHTYPLEETII